MMLRISTPLSVVVDDHGVTALRAEDASGCFGIRPGHADFLTRLAISVVRWTSGTGTMRYCAVRSGVMMVEGGHSILISTREAVTGDDLATLDAEVLSRFRSDVETQRTERIEGARIQLNAIRKMARHFGPHRSGTAGSTS